MATMASNSEEKTFTKNYASDSKVADRFLDYVRPLFQRTRYNRKMLEAKWLEDTRLWSCLLDSAGYVGRSNIFVPELHNQIESTVEKALSSQFSNSDLIDAIPLPGTDLNKCKAIKEAVLYELQTKNNLLTLMDSYERGKIMRGTGIMKGRFEKIIRQAFVKDPKTLKVKIQDVPTKLGVYWEAKSLFRWYIYPEFASLDDYELIFEDDLQNYAKMKQDKRFVNLGDYPDYAVRDDAQHYWVDVNLMEMSDLSQALTDQKDKILITECYCLFDLFNDGKPVPMQAFIANDTKMVRLVRNPYWWQDHPYVGDVYIPRADGVFYGMSMPDKLRSQQYQMNDLSNHTMDSLTYSLNPMAVVDPALAGDVNSMKVAPGAKWLGSPEGIQMISFPDVSAAGLRGMQEIRGQIQQFSDNSPGLAPQLEGKARSATQASIVQTNVSVRQKVQGAREEENVFIPMCKKTHIMLEQFMDKEWIVKISGPDKGTYLVKNVNPADIVGDVDFTWKGTSYAAKTAVRSQQLLGLLQQSLQIAAMMPGSLDISTFFTRIAKEAFDVDGLEDLFKDLRDKKTVDADMENIALKDEEDVPIHNGDNDDEHILVHAQLFKDKKLSDDAKLNVIRHIETHRAQKKAKADLVALKARMQVLQQMQGQDGGQGGPQPGNAPNGVQTGAPQPPSSPLEGNNQQVPTSSAGVMTGAKGVIPQ